jgi:CheY-like chemotaxis protein
VRFAAFCIGFVLTSVALAGGQKPPPFPCALALDEPPRPPLLIVDGDHPSTHLLGFYLRNHGYEPVVTRTLREADAIRRAQALAGAFIHLPDNDDEIAGARLRFARRLRERHRIPVVLLSDQTMIEDRLDGFTRLGRPLDTTAIDLTLQLFEPGARPRNSEE